MAWFKQLDLPDPAYLLEHPRKFKVPEKLDSVFVVLDGVSTLAVNIIAQNDQHGPGAWDAAWQIINAVCEADMQDVALSAAKKLANARKPEFTLPHKTLKHFGDILAGME